MSQIIATARCKVNEVTTHNRDPQYLSDISEKDQKFDYHRSDTQDISSLYQRSHHHKRLHERMEACSDVLMFAEVANTETGEMRWKLQRGMFCKVRHCPVCAWRKSMRNTARFFSALPSLHEKYPTAKWLFLTLTVKNCDIEHTRDMLKEMNIAWKRLIQRKDWPGLGFIRSTEITRGKDGTAHPHFHAVVMVNSNYFTKNYITQEAWTNAWQSALRSDYKPIVDVRRVKPKVEGQTLQAALIETLKYSIKVEDAMTDPKFLYTMTEQLHKTRFLSTGGALKEILREDMTDAEMIAGDEEQDPNENKGRELLFGWTSKIKKYKRVSSYKD